MKPFFSVIVPAYNCAHLISETLDSALAQDFRDFEIIVVNDGSTDNTSSVLESYRNAHDNYIKVIQQQNKGEGGARNCGIFAANGQYLAFLDQDDLWFPWTLQKYHDVLCEHEYPAILIATGQTFHDVTEVEKNVCQDSQVVCYENFFVAAKRKYLPAGTPGTIVKATEAQRVGGLSEDRVIGIDMEFFWKLGDIRGVLHLVSPVTVAIRRHGQNLQSNTKMAVKGALLFINKELQQRYPGGEVVAWARRAIISRSVRTISLTSLNEGNVNDAWILYRRTFKWHIYLCRFRYLFIFPLIYIYKKFGMKGE